MATRRTLFISDLHLCAETPQLFDILVRFLAREVGAGVDLYILGDMVEAWVGDDDPDPLWSTLADAFNDSARRGATLYFMHGNRDFLLGEVYAARASLQILDDPTVVQLGGRRTLLTHGDRYSTADIQYVQFRSMTRDAAWQSALLAKPLAERQALARSLRQMSLDQSERHILMGDAVVDDVIADAIAHDAERIIHGHTHRPAAHLHRLPDGRQVECIVLADWREDGEYLEVFEDGSTMRHPLRK